jgi:hypothetical protein
MVTLQFWQTLKMLRVSLTPWMLRAEFDIEGELDVDGGA